MVLWLYVYMVLWLYVYTYLCKMSSSYYKKATLYVGMSNTQNKGRLGGFLS